MTRATLVVYSDPKRMPGLPTSPPPSAGLASGSAAARPGWPSTGSGPRVSAAFRILLGATFLVAFASLGVQIRALVGEQGLLPAARFLDAIRAREGGAVWTRVPTIFWLGAGDGALVGGILAGCALAGLAAAGVRPRLCFALLTALYLSYASVGRDFLSFQ